MPILSFVKALDGPSYNLGDFIVNTPKAFKAFKIINYKVKRIVESINYAKLTSKLILLELVKMTVRQ